MATMRGGAEPHRHLLHNERHKECEHDKRNEESNAKPRARRSIGAQTGPVVFSEHHKNPGPNKKPHEANSGENTTPRPRGEHALTILRAGDVLRSPQQPRCLL